MLLLAKNLEKEIREHLEDMPEVKDWRWSPVEPTAVDAPA